MEDEPTSLDVSEKATRYVRSHTKEIVNKWAGDDAYGSENVVISVFMAGSPGAGKTEVSKHLLEILEKDNFCQKIVRIDTDEIRISLPQYVLGQAELLQRAASLAVDKIHDYVLKNSKNFILDSTFSNYDRAALNIQRSLKRNREVVIFYIYLDPIKAWDYTQKREKLEGRNIRKEDFINHFFNAKDVVNKVKEIFGKDVVINMVERDTITDDIKLSINIDSIDNHIKIKHDKEYLKNILKELL